MKQLLQNLRSGETLIAEVPIPRPAPGTALVRTAASLVSAGTERMVVEFAARSLLGKARSRPDLLRQVLDKARREGVLTTLEAALNRLDQPMPLGYSSAGTVVAIGEGLRDFRLGDRVACAGGGYAVHAEYAVVPQNLLAHLPDNVDFESAAFATLGAVALHGFRLAEVQVGARVAVIGLGLLGLLTVGIARAAGCAVLGVDLHPDRVARGKRAGAAAVPRSQAEEAARTFSRSRGVDAVLICADTPSNDPVTLAAAIARDRARIIALGAVGLHIPRKQYYEKELTLLVSRSYGPGRYDPQYEERGHDYPIGYVRWSEGRNLEAFLDLLAEGRLEVQSLITHRFPIEQAPQAYELITSKAKQLSLGILLTYPEPPAEPPSLTLSPDTTPARDDTVQLGILGAGSFATAVMLPTVRKIPTIHLAAIASARGLSAQHAAHKFGIGFAASEAAQVIHHPQVNTLAILTRHHLHAEQVVAALQAGKHVFCEKPLALNQEQLASVIEHLAHTSDAPLLTVGFNRRFAPLAQKLAAFLNERQEPLYAYYRVNAGYLPPDHWLHDPEQGGGRLIGEACHFVDFLTFLVGAPPTSVRAHALPDQGRYRQDNFQLTFTFPDGSLGTLTYLANGDKAFPKERVEVFTGGRVAVLQDFRSLTTVHHGRRRTYRAPLRQDKGHRAIWQAFAQAITTGAPPPIPYEQLIAVTQATFAALTALRTGECVSIE